MSKFPFTINLSIDVKADTLLEAHELGIAIIEHLMDTFNDDESLDPLVGLGITKAKQL